MKYVLALLVALNASFGLAQTQFPAVLVQGQVEMATPATVWPSLRNHPEVMYENAAYLLVQLRDMPDQAAKAGLASQGIALLSYVPNASWLARIDRNLSSSDLVAAGLSAMGALPVKSKLPLEMQTGQIPGHAGDAFQMQARVLFWKQDRALDYGALCAQAGLEVGQVDERWSAVEVSGNWQQVTEFAAHPLVQFIEWPEPPIENEVLNELTLIQSNYISDNPGRGLFFDGSGVTIAVNEGGIVNPVENPNFKGRLDRSLESGNVSGHKTGVGRRMASAGNVDPTTRGTAFGATLASGGINFGVAAGNGVTIVNNSFGYGCISGSVTYNSGAANNDNLVRTNPGFMITYSCGNAGSSDCGWGAGPGWANITGIIKSAKNIFAVGALNREGDLTGFSSRGPAWDGRILPDVCATGPGGTSHASPNLAGMFAQLLQAYRSHNSNVSPPTGLLKGIILNTADELENPGPDFKSGYGKVNARRAYEVIRQGQHLTATVAHGDSNTHSLTVPANVGELRVMVYWTDYEATAGIVTKALVNDLDITLRDPAMVAWQPWVLDPTPNAATLNLNAVRGTDTLNNVEQVTLSNPAAGTYTLKVNGSMVPQGPQTYFVIYEYVYDEVVVSYPAGGEHFLPQSTERLRWESLGGSGAFDLAWSADGGTTWSNIATGLPASDRYYDWTVPDSVTRLARIRVQRSGASAISDTNFHVLARPTNLAVAWSCADSSLLVWDSIPQADGYIVYRLGANYMDSVAYATTTQHLLNNLSTTDPEWLAVASVRNGAISRRTIAIERLPMDTNCVQSDAALNAIVSPGTRFLPSCFALPLTVELHNNGVNPISNIPVAYRIDGGPVTVDTVMATVPSAGTLQATLNPALNLSAGPHLIEAWAQLVGDPNLANDTVMDSVTVFAGTSAALQLSESFDSFTGCSTAWGCAGVTCSLSQGWYNVPNVAGGDDIDWRTHSGSTGTGGTGPSGDHTSGNGNYLYLEGSGNGGSGCQNATALLYSPCVDLTGVNQPMLTFWYHALGSAIGSLHVDVIAGGVLYTDIVPPVVGAQGNQWLQGAADLSAFVGHEIVLVMRGTTGGGFAADLAIDDISISALPTPNFAVSDTALCLNQTAQFTNTSILANSYQWQVTPASFAYQNSTNGSSAQPEISFSSPGQYTVQLTATNTIGSDSLVQTNYITVAPANLVLQVDDADTTYCDGDSVTLRTVPGIGPLAWYQNGTLQYTGMDTVYTFTNVVDQDVLYLQHMVNASCTVVSDSVTVQVLPNPVTTLTQTGPMLTADQAGASYQWLDCNNNFAPVPGATNQNFTPLVSGDYACQVAFGDCADTTVCANVVIVGLETGLAAQVQVYPNPASTLLRVQSPLAIDQIAVLDLLGKEVLRARTRMLSVKSLAAGVYILAVETELGTVHKRFVKE